MRIGLVTATSDLTAALQETISQAGHESVAADNILHLLPKKCDLIFVEWRKGGDFPAILAGMKIARESQQPVVVLAPLGALTAMRRAHESGASDVLFYPLDREEILAEIYAIVQGAQINGIDVDLFRQMRLADLVGESIAFKKCLHELRLAAQSDANVLLLGETGTGKEVFAQAIHRLGRRAGQPFLGVNCAALAESLIESELFGHVKGAFTGADSSRKGRFEEADTGTLLIDEIGRMSITTQTKLLRVLDQRVFCQVGASRPIPFQARLICATSTDLDESIANGTFHKDLRGRIDQLRITLPPLRDRRADLPILLRHFLWKHAGGRTIRFSRSAQETAEHYDYPENVRELENMVIGAIAHCGNSELILPQHLPEKIVAQKRVCSGDDVLIRIHGGLSYKEARERAEREVDRMWLQMLLARNQGNVKKAAQEAQIDRQTFAARIQEANDATES
jgi:DNA-binding NtrC family response regulator